MTIIPFRIETLVIVRWLNSMFVQSDFLHSQ